MTDELTISEAVQQFEVSRKTVRRRLAEGAIDGARQRPGDHGPEWIFPASSLEALGYRLRDASSPAADSDSARAPKSASEQSFERDRRRRGLAAVWVVLALVFGPLIGFLVANLLDSDETADTPPLEAVLDELTRPGDRIGVVRPLDADLPSGRVAVAIESDELGDLGDEVRYVVVGDDVSADTLTSLQSSARLVLALEAADQPRWVFDTEQAPIPTSATSAAPPATDDVEPPSTDPPTTATPTTVTPTTVTPTTVDPGPPVEGDTDDAPVVDDDVDQPTPGTTVRGTVTVEAGDHFWSIAEDIVTESLGTTPTDAQITSYWAELVEANADQLVEPGNPDLLLPGQVLQLPAG